MVIVMKSSKSKSWLLVVFALLLLLLPLVWGTNIQKASSLGGFIGKSNATLERSDEFKQMLVPITDVSATDLLLDISENSTRHIEGSIVIPYTNFIVGGGILKSVPEIAQIFGGAGISRDDSIVVYGECKPCGYGPAPATYVYWIMKCMGHKTIRVLDGTIEEWAAAGLPTTNKSTIKPPKNYTPMFNPDLIATYDYVESSEAKIVDARSFQQFNASSIPGAINIPYDSVLHNGTIKNETALKEIFADLSKDDPVIVFTETGIKASVVWFTLKMLGYNARLYSWQGQDWSPNQATEGISRA